ncbi:MAG TPA: hypothetical protein VF247_06700 [Candidatus Krumholzibacteria bacterium]
MRSTRILKQGLLLAVCAALAGVLAGCPKHENLPTALDVVEAAAPDSFKVTAHGIDGDGNYDYDLTWRIADSSVVDRYRLYLVGAGFTPELVYETTPSETDALALPVTLPYNGQGLQFGLSSVSTGAVESAMTVATIPAYP